MPVFSYQDRQIFFAHIPRAAGSSLENYVQSRGGSVWLLDRKHFKRRRLGLEVSLVSPQHWPGDYLGTVLAGARFSAVFAVVRHPVARLVSSLNFLRYWEQLPRDLDMNQWIIDELPSAANVNARLFDNHFLPQSKMCIPGQKTTIFRHEDGLQGAKSLIDTQLFQSPNSGEMPHSNSTAIRSPEPVFTPNDVTTDASRCISEVYSEDFRIFRYEQKAF